MGGGIAIRANKISITLGVIHTMAGRNTAKGTYLSAGVSHAW